MKAIGLSIATVLLAGSADASTFTFSTTVRPDAAQELSSTYSFNDQTDVFGMTFDIDNNPDVDGAWWVVSNGPNPASQGATKLAILYTDLTNVWAYEYTGEYRLNDPNAAGTLLEYFSDAVTSSLDTGTGTSIYSVSIDATNLNSAATANNTTNADSWEGLQFGEQIGTWLHPTLGAFDNCDADANDANGLSCFNGDRWIGWDIAGQDTDLAPVPLPAGGLLLLSGLGGIAAFKRRKKRAA